MYRLIAVFCLATLAALSGCVAMQPATSPQIQGVEDDKFSDRITINGHKLYDNPFGGTIRSWFIRSWVDKKTQEVSHQLYVSINYLGNWKFFETASDDEATALRVVKISTHVGDCNLGSCSLDETVGVDLTDAVLKSRVAQGYAIKLYAKSGDTLILDISPTQIQLQLDATAKYPPGSTGPS